MTCKLLLSFGMMVCLVGATKAQIGLTASYFKNKNESWYLSTTDGESSSPLMDNGYAFGGNYWFRLKNYRVEFLPELNVGFANATWSSSDKNNVLAFKHTTANLFFNTQFYLLNIKGDCDCPVFSKEGPTFEKGLFLFLSPGLTFLNTKAARETETTDDQALSFSLGGGIGMDFGVSDFLTITPLLGVRYYPQANFPDLETVQSWIAPEGQLVAEESLLQYFAGLRFGVRFDYNNRRRRR